MDKGFSLPNKDGFKQPNNSDSQGNIFMTYGIDLESEKGRVAISTQVKKLLSDEDNADFAGYAGSIGVYSTDGAIGKVFAMSDKAFSTNYSNPLGTYTEETDGNEPDTGNTISDAVFFDGLYLISEAADIKSWNGTTWASWWQGTAGQSALASGERHEMWVGADGNLYIVDDGNKVYRVTPTGTVTKTGNGSLDFSATQYEITCAVTNSTRSWIGTVDKTGNEAVLIEWDMSPSAASANRLHPMGAKAVRCIAIWNDTPIAILSNGKVKYFNGASFVEFNNSVQFPVTDGYQLDNSFIHPNGWAIIDDLPHFLVTGKVENASPTTGARLASYKMSSGVWCLDPSIGLYHRFPIGTGESVDYGKMQVVEVGALYSLQRNDSKFLASYEYRLPNDSANRSVLVYHDANRTLASRGFLMTPFAYSLRQMWKSVEVFHKKLQTNEKIRIYYRSVANDILGQSGTWASTTQFNIVATDLGLQKGDVAFVKMGNGSGQLLKIEKVEESSSTTSITFTEPNTFAATNESGVLDFLNFRSMGEVTSTTKDYETFTVPESARNRKMQFLFEFQQVAGNTMELDFGIINV